MPARELRGAPVARSIRDETAAAIAVLADLAGIAPTLVTLRLGTDPSAAAYRSAIDRQMQKVGVVHRPLDLPTATGPAAFVTALDRLNRDPAVHGVLLLTPLPPHLSVHLAMEHLSAMKDVDGITPLNAGRLHLGLPALRPSTPQGGLELLDYYGIEIAGRDAVVVGRSNVVGKPMAALLTRRNATVTLCHRQTRRLADVIRRADLVVLAAGSPGLLTREAVKAGAVVVDFGINLVGDRIVGDADPAVAERVGAYTPVPGGTGPVTTMVLARNTVAAAFACLGAGGEALPGVILDSIPADGSTPLPEREPRTVRAEP